MLKDALKWISLAAEVMKFAEPLSKALLASQGQATPEWLDDLTDFAGKALANAQAGVTFDESLAARIRTRLAALPDAPEQADLLAAADAIRDGYADFKSVMAARRAAAA